MRRNQPPISVVDPVAVALGYKNWNYGPDGSTGSSAPGSGNIFVMGIWLPSGTVCTGVAIDVAIAGVGVAPTGVFLGLADSATPTQRAATGNLIDGGTQQAKLTGAVGTKEFDFAAPYTTPADAFYYLMLLKNGAFGTTDVAFGHRGVPVTSSARSGGKFPFGVAGSGKTTLPGNGVALDPITTSARPFRVAIY